MGSSNSRHASASSATVSGGAVVATTDGRDQGEYPAASTRRESQARGSRERNRLRFCGGRFRSSSRHQQQQNEAATPSLTTSNGFGNGSDPRPVTLGASLSGRRNAAAKGNASSNLEDTVIPVEQQRDQSAPFSSSAAVAATSTAQASGSSSNSISAASPTEPISSTTAIPSAPVPHAATISPSAIAEISFTRNNNVENSSSRSSSSDNSTSSTRRSSFNSPPRVLSSSRHHRSESGSGGGLGRSSSVGLVMEILPMAVLGAAAAASAGAGADRDPISMVSSADLADSRPIRSLGSAAADARHLWLEGHSSWGGGAARFLGSSGGGGGGGGFIDSSSSSSAAGGSGGGSGGSSSSSNGALAGLSQSNSRQNNPQAVGCDSNGGVGGPHHHHRHEMNERLRRSAGLPPSSSLDIHDLERRGVLTSSAESSGAQSQRTGNASSSMLGSDHHHDYHHHHHHLHHHNNWGSGGSSSSRRGDEHRTWGITEEGRLIEYRHSMYSESWGGERNWSFHRSESQNGSSTTTAGDSSSSNNSNNNTTSSSSSTTPRQQPPPPLASSSSTASTTTATATATPLVSSASGSASASAAAAAAARESRRHGSSGRRLWDTLTRHRRASTPLSVPASSESASGSGGGSGGGGGGDGGSSGWGIPQSSDDEHMDIRSFHHNRSPDLEERRLRVRSQVWALQLLSNGLDGMPGYRPCTSGGHHHGHCSCEMHPSAEESSTRASISRIIMLAEALFEVLDEIHRQSIALSRTSAPIASLPAPDDVVEAIPTKKFSKKWWEEATQCNICLVEYEEGDQVRVLPCQHEYHQACVDKWLKEVHRVCPLCRGNVCETNSGAHSPLST